MALTSDSRPEGLADVRYVFTDIDDTLTTHGRLLPETYEAIWALSRAGISVVPVTGGSAGWCEHIVRAWPVAAAIGESGAFVMTLENGEVATEYWQDRAVQRQRQADLRGRIDALIAEGRFGRFAYAHDQDLRYADLALVIAGHPRENIDAMVAHLQSLGARTGLSSIHINAWFGDYNKQTMSERLLRGRFGLSADAVAAQTAFVGDSGNDGPMFAYVRNSFGVANVAPHLDRLPVAPRWITAREAGLGFADVARILIAART